MLEQTIHRLSSQRATCKLCSVFLGIAILLEGALGGLERRSLLWIAAPLLLLWLADAGYAAQQRRCAEALKNRKGNDEGMALPTESAGAVILDFVFALFSLSSWPFYLGLLGTVGTAAFLMPVKVTPAPVAPAPNPPGHYYRPATPYPMPQPNVPPRPFNGTPFPGHTPMNPAFPRNGLPIFPQPNVNRAPNSRPGQTPSTDPSSTPTVATPAASTPATATPTLPTPPGKKP